MDRQPEPSSWKGNTQKVLSKRAKEESDGDDTDDAAEMAKFFNRGMSTVSTAAVPSSAAHQHPQWQATRFIVRPQMLADIFMRLKSRPTVNVFDSLPESRKSPFILYLGRPWQQVWKPERGTLWLNPAVNDIKKVLDKVRDDKSRGVIIVPNWDGEDWFEQLWSMVVRYHWYGPDVPLYRGVQPTWGSWACLVDGSVSMTGGDETTSAAMTVAAQEVQKNKSSKRRLRRRTLRKHKRGASQQ